MSGTGWTATIAAVVAFALALYAIREAIGLKTAAERVGRWALLATAAGGGAMLVTVAATLVGALWVDDPIGLVIAAMPMRVVLTLGVVLGLACVVLGPVLRDAVFAVIRRKGGVLPEKAAEHEKPQPDLEDGGL